MNAHTRPLRLALLFLSLCVAYSGAMAADVRFATFNVAMGLREEGDLARSLATGEDEGLRKFAAILQLVRPDVVLINEFDWQPDVDAADLFHRHYLSRPQFGHDPIAYDHAYTAPVNTGVDSGLDLDQDGELHGPGDAWGWGRFPGQYGMLVLSRHPIDQEAARTFQRFLWRDLPEPTRPLGEDGKPFYTKENWLALRLSSKSHWDLPIRIGERTVHLLASHPTPPAFDGPEDRNGARNRDEIRFWDVYLTPGAGAALYDDAGEAGGLPTGASFVIAGDLNASVTDGGSRPDSIGRLLANPRVNDGRAPTSRGAVEAGNAQGGANTEHRGDPALDTADFSDEEVGNLRADYVLPSRDLTVTGCGVYWPAAGEPGHELVGFSDHRLVWVDIEL